MAERWGTVHADLRNRRVSSTTLGNATSTAAAYERQMWQRFDQRIAKLWKKYGCEKPVRFAVSVEN